jgi:hypothetical protein
MAIPLLLLGAIKLDTLLDRLEFFGCSINALAGTLCITAKDELSTEIPLLRNVPVTHVSLVRS